MRLPSFLVIPLFILACGGGSSSAPTDGARTVDTAWSIDVAFVRDGGPGKDGIPAIDSPRYVSIADANFVNDLELVIGTKIDGIARAFPHSVLNWHEVVNVETGTDHHTLSYCPLTGTAALWTVPATFAKKTFGVSGLLFNSNLILYDRETDSNWPQMLAVSARGSLKGSVIEENAVIETTWGTWKRMYPETTILSNNTGFSRNYTSYPYGDYRTNTNLLFQVAHSDSRLHQKTRVLGINNGGINKVYEVAKFANGIEVLNENQSSNPFVVVGSSQLNFAVAFNSTLVDGTKLTFTALDTSIPIIMLDNEGNQWNVFGEAISGLRAGQQLALRSDFIAFWFAWVAISPNPDIHGFN